MPEATRPIADIVTAPMATPARKARPPCTGRTLPRQATPGPDPAAGAPGPALLAAAFEPPATRPPAARPPAAPPRDRAACPFGCRDEAGLDHAGSRCRWLSAACVALAFLRFLPLGGVHPVPERGEITSTDDVDELAVAAAGHPFGAAFDPLDLEPVAVLAEQPGEAGVTGHGSDPYRAPARRAVPSSHR